MDGHPSRGIYRPFDFLSCIGNKVFYGCWDHIKKKLINKIISYDYKETYLRLNQ